MAQATNRDVNNTIASLENVDAKTRSMIAQLERKDNETRELIRQREEARRSGQHSKFAQLEAQLMSSLSVIENMERTVIAQLNKDFDFDKSDNDGRLDFMLNENAELNQENEMLALKIEVGNEKNSQFVKIYNDKSLEVDNLVETQQQLEAELAQLEGATSPDNIAIARKKEEIQVIVDEILALQKEMEKMQKIFKLEPEDCSIQIEKNTRVIQNNLKNIGLRNVDAKNYGKASEIIGNMYSTHTKQKNMFSLASQYAPFEKIMSAEEFKYLAENYERENGKPLSFNENAKTGRLYKWLHREDLKALLRARYPHLAGKENKRELDELYKEQSDALATIMQSGINGEMLRNLYRDFELDVRYYQNNKSDRSEWLKSLQIERSGADVDRDNEQQQGVPQNEQRQGVPPEQQQGAPQNEQRQGVPPEQQQGVPQNVQQTIYNNYQNPSPTMKASGNILDGIEILNLPPAIVAQLKNMNIKNIGELVETLNKNGILLNVVDITKTQKKQPNKQEPELAELDADSESGKTSNGKNLDSIPFSGAVKKSLAEQGINNIDDLKNKIENGEVTLNKTAYKVLGVWANKNGVDMGDLKSKISELETAKTPKSKSTEVPEADNTEKTPTRKKSKTKQPVGTDINNIPFSGVLQGKLVQSGITTVEDLVSRLEKGEDIPGFNQSGYKVLRQFCGNNNVKANIDWEGRISSLRASKPAKKVKKESKNNDDIEIDMEGILSDRNIVYKNDDTIQKYAHDDEDRDDR